MSEAKNTKKQVKYKIHAFFFDRNEKKNLRPDATTPLLKLTD